MRRDIIKTVLAFLFLILSFGFAGGCDKADATVTPPAEGWGNAYQQAALGYWGGAEPTMCSTYSVQFDSPYPHTEVSDAAGMATMPEQYGSACTVWVSPMHGHGIYERCVVYAHEYGHTLGHDHVSDEHSVMYAETGPYTHDRPCRELVKRVHQ